MKRHITLTALSVLTLLGGSWLAAQQGDAVRTTRSIDKALDESGQQGVAETVTEKRFMDATRTGTTLNASQRTTRPRPALGPAEFREDAARFAEEVRRVVIGPNGERILEQPGFQQRMTPADAARMRAFQDAIRELREAGNPEEKTVARERVTKLVSEQLDADLENREEELAAIELRAKELRKQLEERKTAKPELLKMLVMLIDNPQVGLGIPPEWMQMLMRGQPDRYRQGDPVNGPDQNYPPTPMRPSVPPRAGIDLRRDSIVEQPIEKVEELAPAESPRRP